MSPQGVSRPSSAARHRLLPGTEVEFLEENGTVTLRKAKGTRRRDGRRRSPLPEFYIGAHAAVRRHTLLTRDASRYRTYFPGLDLFCPS